MEKLQHTKFYRLYHEKIKEEYRIVSISDLHFSPKVTTKKLNSIYNTLQHLKPHYILIPGDLIDSSNMIEQKAERMRLYTWIISLAKLSKVIISLGNHDCYQRGKFVEDGKKCKVRYFYDKIFFQSLAEIPNVYILDNSIYEDQNVYIAGLNLPFEYYRSKPTKEKRKEEDKSLLIKTLNENLSILTKLPNQKIKVLMVHSPVFLTEKKIEKKLEEFNYFIAGHMHNGCVFPLLDELWNSTYGIISPKKTFFPKNARNTLRKKEDKLIVNGAITTFQACTKWMQLLNILFPMNITVLEFTKDSKYSHSEIFIKSKYHK